MAPRFSLHSESREDDMGEDEPMMRSEQPSGLDPEFPFRRSADGIPQEKWREGSQKDHQTAWSVSLLILCCLSLFTLSEVLLSSFFSDPILPLAPQASTTVSPQLPAPTQTPEKGHDNGLGIKLERSNELDLKTGFVVSNTPTVRDYVLNITLGRAAPDGFGKSMILINGRSPGPLIEANTGDTLRIVVNNMMPEASTTIHWHGIDQRNSSWMDGVNGVSQCGIPPGETFTYQFNVTGQRGTFWYHSHVSVQYTNGLYGPLIIHDPDERIPSVNDEKIILFGDLFHQDAEELASQYLGTEHPWSRMAGMEPPPDNIIINGYHVSNCSSPDDELQPQSNSSGVLFDVAGNCTAGSIYNTQIQSGDQVRFRLISHSTSTPFWITIDNHTLEIFEIDGVEIDPIVTARVFVTPGQRYSVLVKANQTPGHYRIRTTAAIDCFHLPGGTSSALAKMGSEAVAILSYEGVDADAGVIGVPWDLNSLSSDGVGPEPWSEDCGDLPFDLPKPLRQEAAYKVGDRNYHYVSFERNIFDGKIRSSFNQTIYTPLEKDATLWRTLDLDKSLANITGESPGWDLGEDQFVLVSRDTDMGAQIVVNSQAMMMHPFHLHGIYPFSGQDFQIVGWGDDRYGESETTWNFDNPMRRDTLSIPGFSHVVLRIRADNPGIWAFHCHILWHAEDGMFMSFANRLDELGTSLKTLDLDARRKFCSIEPR